MNATDTFIPPEYISFGLAILLGALVGTERQFAAGQSDKSFGGIRTFVFIALGGAIAAFIDDFHISGFFMLSFAGTSLLVLSNHMLVAQRGGDTGTTTEIVSPLLFALGGLCWWQHYNLAIALVIAILFFLSSKRLLHRLTQHMSYDDISASVALLVITFIVLPLAPNRGMGPFAALNPYRIWLFVVLVSLLSFAAYVTLKLMRQSMGIIVTGVLGGIVSSTAATVTLAKRSKETPEYSRTFAVAAAIASATMPMRAVALVILVLPSATAYLIPIAIPGVVVGAAISTYVLYRKRGVKSTMNLNNPFRLTVAINFGVIFASATLLAHAATGWLGDRGVLLASALSGTVSADAAVLSIGEYGQKGLSPTVVASGVAVAILANCIFKAAVAYFAGSSTFRKYAAPLILAIGLLSCLPLVGF